MNILFNNNKVINIRNIRNIRNIPIQGHKSSRCAFKDTKVTYPKYMSESNTEPDLPTLLVAAIAPAIIHKALLYNCGGNISREQITADVMRECSKSGTCDSSQIGRAHV